MYFHCALALFSTKWAGFNKLLQAFAVRINYLLLNWSISNFIVYGILTRSMEMLTKIRDFFAQSHGSLFSEGNARAGLVQVL
jgi:hypothetical protein